MVALKQQLATIVVSTLLFFVCCVFDSSCADDSSSLSAKSMYEEIQPKLSYAVQPTDWNVDFGHTIAMSDDGLTLATGGNGIHFSSESGQSGAIFVYLFNGTRWTPLGPSLTAKGFHGQGRWVAVNGNGSTIATATVYGHILVYSRNATTVWLRNVIVSPAGGGPDADARFVSLSANAETLAFYSSLTGAYVFELSGSIYKLRGRIPTTSPTTQSFQGLCLSGDGSIITVSVDDGHSVPKGRGIEAYRRNPSNSSAWYRIGRRITGHGQPGYASNSFFGRAMALSYDGGVLVASGAEAGYFVGVYLLTNTLEYVLQQPLVPNTRSRGLYGYSLAITHDGTRVVVGHRLLNDRKGGFHVFQLRKGGKWTERGLPVFSKGDTYLQGESIAISAGGERVAMGSTRDNGVGALVLFEDKSFLHPTMECSPISGVSKATCQELIEFCSTSMNVTMKWTGRSCGTNTNRADSNGMVGGCQCARYCGYKCRESCSSDRACYWSRKNKVCFEKATNMKSSGNNFTRCSSGLDSIR